MNDLDNLIVSEVWEGNELRWVYKGSTAPQTRCSFNSLLLWCLFVVLVVFLECTKSLPTSSSHFLEHYLSSWLHLILWKTQKVEILSPLLDTFNMADNSFSLSLPNFCIGLRKRSICEARDGARPQIVYLQGIWLQMSFFWTYLYKMSWYFPLSWMKGPWYYEENAPALQWGTRRALFSVVKDKNEASNPTSFGSSNIEEKMTR